MTETHKNTADLSAKDGIAVANEARAELQQTLQLLAQKLDYPTRIDNAVKEKTSKLKRLQRTKPVQFAVTAGLVSLAVGAAVTALAVSVASKGE